jgi:biotin/methionine sulfoxide reductase
MWSEIDCLVEELATATGAVGLNGHGIGYHSLPSLAQGKNNVSDFIPVARIADLLLHGGEEYDYNGRRLTYPETKLVYWAGGNPFHHHQDLNRLARAWQRPDTIVVHELFWNALADRHRVAGDDHPGTRTSEEAAPTNSSSDGEGHRPCGRPGDYDIFSELAKRLDAGEKFTEGRTGAEWLEHLYSRYHETNPDYPTLEELKYAGHFEIPEEWYPPIPSQMKAFRDDPIGAALKTPSGRIELYS